MTAARIQSHSRDAIVIEVVCGIRNGDEEDEIYLKSWKA